MIIKKFLRKIVIMLCLSFPIMLLPMEQDQQAMAHVLMLKEKKLQEESLWVYKTAIIASLITLFWITANEEVGTNFLEQLTAKNLLYNFLCEYGSWSMSTIVHELGHALAAHAIGAHETSIYFGSIENDTPIASIGKLHLSGFNPHQGNTRVTWMREEEKRMRLCTSASQFAAAHKLNPSFLGDVEHRQLFLQSDEFLAYKNSLMPPKILHAVFLFAGGMSSIGFQQLAKASLKLDALSVNQLISSLVPFRHNSDGAVFWRDCAGFSNDWIEKISEIAVLLEIVSELYWAINDVRSTAQVSMHSKIILGFLNYFMRGYLRFYA